MKKFELFFFKVKLWKVWIINTIFITSACFIFAHLMDFTMGIHSGFINSFSIFMGLVFGGVLTSMMYLSRVANDFFREADKIEELAKKATNKKQIRELWNTRLMPLQKKNFHRQTGQRLKELSVLMNTRYEFLPEIETVLHFPQALL